MQIIVLAEEDQKEEFITKKTITGTEIIFAENFSGIVNHALADALFILSEEVDKTELATINTIPVFFNSTIDTLKELNLPKNFIRINGWNTFLKRETWEIATNNIEMADKIFKELEWKYLMVNDEPGLVSARIISMIINEAYFALGEKVSTKNEIDIAMKLGTNYPYGPFEWSEKIGLKKSYALLEKLSKTDNRYNMAPEMETELNN
ncbi:MAG: 3-hydroxyacyl-CoA dehydrogenase family protein [Bacteroidota bacterium]|nr:3-hydroxyacyl-CoA dehydrogenase family protein [Bacteroidota bacterium]